MVNREIKIRDSFVILAVTNRKSNLLCAREGYAPFVSKHSRFTLVSPEFGASDDE